MDETQARDSDPLWHLMKEANERTAKYISRKLLSGDHPVNLISDVMLLPVSTISGLDSFYKLNAPSLEQRARNFWALIAACIISLGDLAHSSELANVELDGDEVAPLRQFKRDLIAALDRMDSGAKVENDRRVARAH